MNPQINFLDEHEVEQVRSWVMSQTDAVQMAAALEVARLRIFDAANPLFSLRFAHSASTRNEILSGLRAPSISSALKMYEIDPDRFADAVEFEVRRRGTTRPDGFWQACGVGRPPKEGMVCNER